MVISFGCKTQFLDSFETCDRPQCGCRKVMFSQACVKNYVRGVYPSMHSGRPPLPASACWDTPPLGRYPQSDTPPPVRHCLGRHPPGQTPPPMATAADGTHSNGMHSCLKIFLNAQEHLRLKSMACLLSILIGFRTSQFKCQKCTLCQYVLQTAGTNKNERKLHANGFFKGEGFIFYYRECKKLPFRKKNFPAS